MDKVILGEGVELEGGIGSSRPNDNQMIVGGTGTGKSMSVLWPTLCHMSESSFIGTFAKAGEAAKAVPFFKKKGYKVHVWNLAEPEKGDPLPDPLDYVHTDDDIQQLARSIVNCNPRYEMATNYDPYWMEAAEGLLTGIIACVMYYPDPSMKKALNIHNCLKISPSDDQSIQTSIDKLVCDLDRRYPDSTPVRKFHAFQQLPYRTAGCVRDTLDKDLQNMFPRSIEDAMKPEGKVDFGEFAYEKTAIFIITSPVKSILYSYANLMFGIAIRELMEFADRCKGNRLPRPVRLIFDDFSCGFPVQDYEKSISTFRAAGISSMMLIQSESQLEATYGEDKSTTILDNCSTYAYLPGGMNRKTCRSVSEAMNLPMDEIMYMEMGKIIIMQSGKKPQIVKRYDTMSDPLYQEFLKEGSKPEQVR